MPMHHRHKGKVLGQTNQNLGTCTSYAVGVKEKSAVAAFDQIHHLHPQELNFGVQAKARYLRSSAVDPLLPSKPPGERN